MKACENWILTLIHKSCLVDVIYVRPLLSQALFWCSYRRISAHFSRIFTYQIFTKQTENGLFQPQFSPVYPSPEQPRYPSQTGGQTLFGTLVLVSVSVSVALEIPIALEIEAICFRAVALVHQYSSVLEVISISQLETLY